MPAINVQKILSVLVKNWAAKVLAAILAIFLFVFHRLSSLENRFFSAPLQIEQNGELVPANAFPRMVRVRLRGEANSVFPIQEDDIVAYIDLKRYASEGTYRVPVQIRKKGSALGVEPLEITVDPVEVGIELDHKLSRYVSLTPGITGSLEPGYELVSYTLVPAQVVVDGPETMMENLTELRTERIDLDGRSDDFSAQVAIQLDDPRMTIRGANTAEFHGFIKRLVIIRTFENLPIAIDGLAEGLAAVTDVRTGSVRIQGNQDELEPFRPQGALLRLDCSRITAPGNYTLPVIVDIPGSFTLVRSDPTAVTVQVHEQ